MIDRRFRIATWNLERPRPRSWLKLPAQLEQMAAVDADIWVLTETRVSIRPSAEHRHSVHSLAHPQRRPDEDERWVSIWSKVPLGESAVAAAGRWSVAAVVESALGSMTVYGTVIPWSHEREPDGTLRLWDVHGAELGRQAAEWRALSEVGPLCVAGDFNQAWTRGGYGTRALREAHHRAADRAGLACLTAAESANDIPVIDHVLLSRDWADQHSARVSLTWPGRRADGLHMSDHPGVAIDLLAASPSR